MAALLGDGRAGTGEVAVGGDGHDGGGGNDTREASSCPDSLPVSGAECSPETSACAYATDVCVCPDPFGGSEWSCGSVETPSERPCRVVVEVSADALGDCAHEIPDPPPNYFMSPGLEMALYFAGGANPGTVLPEASDGCQSDGVYFDWDLFRVTLCDPLCATLQRDPLVRVVLWFSCVQPSG